MSRNPSASAGARRGLEAFDAIEESFRKFSGRTAVEWRGRSFTYAELDAAARGLASRMDERGAPSGAPVGVFFEDRTAVVAAMLASFRSGRVFLPLDPEAPPARTREVLMDAGPACLLAEAALGGRVAEALQGLPAIETILVDPDEAALERAGAKGAGAGAADPDALAYLCYTSGSTGRPKGIAGRLRGLSHFVRWEIDEFAMAEGPRVSQLTVPTFDAYFRDVLVPLAAGGTICVPPRSLRDLDGGSLAAWIEESRIETLHCVPSLLSTLLYEPLDSDRFPCLRRVLVAGEVLHVEEARRWLELFGDRIVLVNLYGPSETTMVKFFHRVEPGDIGRGFVPIGKPIPGARGLILAPDGSPAPPGVVGELFIRTPYRTLGYYRNPDLTAEAFVRNPFRDDPEDLLYRTGDLARLLPDGNLQFLGRRDDQVKIRGLRVELSEIEGHLRSQPDVRDAAVVSAEAGREARLVAYVVAREGRELRSAELRSFLKSRLPAPMVPAEWALLDRLPRTATGKVDRAALGRMRPDSRGGRPFVAPRTPMEERVADVWAEVLGTGPISRDDDFFENGGHSLLAMQVVSRLQKSLGIDLAVRALFESPTLSGFARALSEAATAAAADPAASRVSGDAPLSRTDREGPIPLSFGQEGLWFLDQLEGGAANNVSRVLRLTGRLDERALREALTQIAGRHEAIRTTYAAPDGRPEQRISSARAVPLETRDLRDRPEEAREDEVRRLVEAEISRPFDLSKDLMLRASLLRLAEDEHVLTLVMHHIASDGWSMGVLTRELSAAYAPFGAVPAALPELPVQYADYARWQRDRLSGERLRPQLAFWKERLGGPAVSLELPADRRRPAEPSRLGASLDFTLPNPVRDAVKRLGREEGATLFMALLAGFYALLHRYTGTTDLRVGSFITNRGRTELEPIIGFFINTLVLRTDLSGDPSFRELLRRVRETTLQAYAHPDVPFERLLEELHPERSLSRTPLFQVAFVLQNTPKPPFALAGLRPSVLRTERRRSRHDLTFMLWERPEGLTATVTYSPELFEPATVERLFGHYRALLEEAAAAPDRRVSEFSLLSAAERETLVVAWNETAADFPLDRPLTGIFDEQASRDPGRVAARCGEEQVTYGELALRAERAARQLTGRGVGPESIVPILAGRGLDFLAAMLAVFKAGAAYLPLDPASPPERLARMIRQSGSPLVIVSRDLGALLDACARDEPEGGRPAAVSIESLGRDAGAPAGPQLPSRPRSLAYVIYTSGSTGLPKGAMVEQAGMLNHLFAKVAALDLTADDVVAQTAPQSFDISVWQYLAPLIVGGRVEVFPDEIAQDPARLLAETGRCGVTVLETVPSLLRAALEERDAGGAAPRLPGLRWLIATGEALPPALGARWLESYPRVPVMNAYGPTECSDDVTHFTMRAPLLPEPAHVPIGRPLPNMRMYVVGASGLPVPLGVAGELWVGGVGVGRGYLGDPARTAEAFVPDPFGGKPGARLYRTGDLVRYGAGGDLVYLGRIDQQVKVGGCRIELGEIEAAMGAHPGVRQTVVAAREAPSGDLRIVAYFVPEGEGVSAGVLRSFLADRLPPFMLPSAFVGLAALPLTPNGKIDRKALPDPGPEAPDSLPPPEEPRNPREAEVRRIWAALLGRERIGVHENFFELGGHSLLATQVISRIRRAFGVTLPIRTLFERPTVAGLADAVEAAGGPPDGGAIPALVAAAEPASGAHGHD